MHKIKGLFVENKKYFVVGLLVLVIVIYFVFGKGNNSTEEVYEVGMANVEQSVILSGKVQTSDRADLGFAASGRLGQIFVKNNQSVFQGQMLAQLEIGDLLADLRIKQANLRTSNVNLESAKDELEKITMRENTKVENAYRTLLSNGLEFIGESNDYDVAPPTIGGIYDGQEGQYKVRIVRANSNSSDFKLSVFGLEKTSINIEEEGPTEFGTKGLFVSFPADELSYYADTIWYLDIPNKTSSVYLANYNAYNQALKERDLAIKQAEGDYQKLLSEGEDDNYTVAEAEIQKINADIRKNTIYAPFNGRVTNIEKQVGENASVGERIISILGEEKLEVVLQVSELDVSRLVMGAEIKLALDAFPAEVFSGILKTINSRETEIDGVPVYEAFVELPADIRIKTGMSANGTVIIANKNNVLAIPSYFINKIDNTEMVQVIDEEGNKIEKTIVTGLVGTDSMVEVISGLSAGEKIVSQNKK